MAAHQAHNLGSQKDKVGSIPTPATKHRVIPSGCALDEEILLKWHIKFAKLTSVGFFALRDSISMDNKKAPKGA